MVRHSLEASLVELKNWIESIAKDNPYGCMILQNNEIAAEWYSGMFDSNALFEIGSIRKTFNSSLMGLCIEEGKIDLVTESSSVWPEIVEISGEIKDKEITLHQLASGTSGWLTPDPPGEKFQYNNAAFTVVEKVLARILKLPEDEIAPEVVKCFKIPLQADSWEVYHFKMDFDPKNNDIPGPKLAINSNLRDLIKWGQVWLNGGIWRDKRIIPQNWVERAIQLVNPEIKDDYYGYNWFINCNKALWPDAPTDSFGHPGFGTFISSGRESRVYLWICPSLNIVAAMVTDIAVGIANDYLVIPQGITAEWIGRIVKALN